MIFRSGLVPWWYAVGTIIYCLVVVPDLTLHPQPGQFTMQPKFMGVIVLGIGGGVLAFLRFQRPMDQEQKEN